MKSRRDFIKATALGVAASKMVACSGREAEPLKAEVPEKTLANLQTAYNGESNAHAKYIAFAAKADADGYKPVGSLFRAVAKAEQIHFTNHAKIITTAGAEPKAKIESVTPGSIEANLKAAIKGEDYEWQEMYPAMIKQAKADKSAPSEQTFDWAMKAEVEHSKLYGGALKNLEAWKGDEPKEFVVCANCGYTTADGSIAKCPVCGAVGKKLMKVS
jgi:rubrerythrin